MIALSCSVFCLWHYGLPLKLPHSHVEMRGNYPLVSIADSKLIAALKPYSASVRWAYCRDNIWGVHVGHLLPPELTNLCKKRFWTGDITEQAVLDCVKRYDCEVLVLSSQIELKQDIWKRFLTGRFVERLVGSAKNNFCGQTP